LREPLAAHWDKRRALPPYAKDFCEALAAHMRDLPTSKPGASFIQQTARSRRNASRPGRRQ
jgi:hypothetical protein